MNYETQIALRKSKRVGFLFGKRAVLAPRDRTRAVQLARHALGNLSPVDQFSLVVDRALAESNDEAIVRCASVLLASLAVLIRRLSVMYKALFIQQTYQEMRRLMGTEVSESDRVDETLH